MVDADRRALEQFLVGNEQLESLEALIGQFNLFEALGVVRHELRHSDFLAYLLDPGQNHGLGGLFLKRLLQRVLSESRGRDVRLSPLDVELWDVGTATVERERFGIDLLVSLPTSGSP